MKRFKYSLLMVFISGFIGILFGLAKNNFTQNSSRIYAQQSVEYNGFDNILENADLILVGEIKNIMKGNEYDEFNIDVCEIEKGYVQENICIRNYLYSYSYAFNGVEHTGQTNCNYKEGEKYLFVLQHIENVYEDKYVILSDTFIPVSENKTSTVMSEPLDNIENPVKYIKDYDFTNKNGLSNELSIKYTKSNQLNVIVEESGYIALVRPKELYRQTDIVDVYLCDVIEVLKGKLHTMEQNQIIIPFFKDTVSLERNYLVHLNTDTDDANIYFLSSKNSVLDESKKKTVMSIMEKKE